MATGHGMKGLYSASYLSIIKLLLCIPLLACRAVSWEGGARDVTLIFALKNERNPASRLAAFSQACLRAGVEIITPATLSKSEMAVVHELMFAASFHSFTPAVARLSETRFGSPSPSWFPPLQLLRLQSIFFLP